MHQMMNTNKHLQSLPKPRTIYSFKVAEALAKPH